jgi:glucan phosphoethanolaminetransferase (alkaline phosphatase superfamily)
MIPFLVTTITGQDLLGVINIATAPTSLTGLVTLIISWLLYLAGILAFIFLVISGITYITASGDPERTRKAQAGLISAIIGIIIISLSYVILRAAGWITTTSLT